MIAVILSSAIWPQTIWSHSNFDIYLRVLRGIYVWDVEIRALYTIHETFVYRVSCIVIRVF